MKRLFALVARLAPDRVPTSEPLAFADAVLPPPRWLRGAAAEAWLVMTFVAALIALVVSALAGARASAAAAFAVCALVDWAAHRAGTRVLRLLGLTGWTEPWLAALVWLPLLAALGEPLLLVVPMVVHGFWLVSAAAAAWLQQRQPPLRFVPGAPVQPGPSVAFARAYLRGVHRPGFLLTIEVAASVAALVLPAWAVAGLAALFATGYGGFVAFDARRLGGCAPQIRDDLSHTLTSGNPNAAVYVSGGIGQSRYLFDQWASTFAAMPRPPIVIVREASQLQGLAQSPSPVVYAPAPRHVEAVCVPSVKVVFYLANGQKNGDLWRNGDLRHVFLGHGDSDKATSSSPIARVYDQIWVAGPSAIERYRQAGINLPPDRFVVVGRPQVADLPVGPTVNQRPVVLYAPTFEGYSEATNYSSLSGSGVALIERLLARGDVTVWFRPHPSTGVQRADSRAARAKVNDIVHAAGPPHRTVDDSPGEPLHASLRQADVLIADVSSVTSDFLQTERPVLVLNAHGLAPDEFARLYPSQAGAYLVDPDLRGLDEGLAAALGSDPLLERRRRLKRDVLGDLPNGAQAAFNEATRALAEA